MLKNKNSIITGAGGGMGASLVKSFAENGSNIWAIVHHLCDETYELFRNIEKDCGIWIREYESEFQDINDIKKTLESVFLCGERIDILVNNAGILSDGTLGMTRMNDLDLSLKVNFIAPSYITKLVSRKMIRNRYGVIVNIISRAALEFRPGAYAYGSSKAALLWGTKAMAKELSPYGIRVNGVAPGLTDTKMGISKGDDYIKNYISENNIKRMASPSEISDVVTYLASDKSSYISGQIISVDGGRIV